MMDCTNHQEELTKVKKLFAEAEGICKKVEVESESGPVIPAINQLRYAGQHLAEATTSKELSVQKSELKKAENHCQRAIYDAAEAGCLTAKVQIEGYKEQFKELPIIDAVPSYSATLTAHGKLKRLIGEKREGVSKQEHYQELAQIFKTLYDGLIDIESHEEELKKILAAKIKDDRIAAQTLENSNETVKQNQKRIYLAITSIVIASALSVGSYLKGVSDTKQELEVAKTDMDEKQLPSIKDVQPSDESNITEKDAQANLEH